MRTLLAWGMALTASTAGYGRENEAGEPFALYISKSAKIEAKSLADDAKDAKITPADAEPDVDAERVRISWPGLSVTANVFRKETDAEHLAGFCGYLQKQAGAMDAHTFHLIRRVQRTAWQISLIPDGDWNDAGLRFVKALAKRHKAIVFGNGSAACDPELRVLLGPKNAREKQAKVPEYDSALKRRQRSFDELMKRKISTIEVHPVIAADEEVRFRSAKAVAERAAVLYAVARAAEDKTFDADKFLRDAGAVKAVSPNERKFLDAKSRDPEQASALTWRYEACHVLLWALGKAPDCRFPDRQTRAPAIWKSMEGDGAKTLIAEAKLRPTAEILDQVDLTYRLAWASRNAKRAGKDIGASPDVVMERHEVFCWLVRHFNRDWDDISADT